jgi:HK97 family phage portal protein
MAGIFNRIQKIFQPEQRSVTVGITDGIGLPYGFSTSPISLRLSMQLSAVYRCVEVIGDAMGSQTWDITEYDKQDGFVANPFHAANYMMNVEPNPLMSRYTMMKTLISKVLLEGYGYLIIRRDKRGDPVRLELVNLTVKKFIRKDLSVYFEIGFEGETETVEGTDVIEILNFSYDGLTGVSTLRHAANTMGLAVASEASAKGFFTSGANMSGILTSEGRMTQEKATALKQAWAAAFNVTSGNPGGIAVMEAGLDFKPVTVNPKDAQMLETRQFNVVEICRFFGVSPSKVFDDKNLTYSNIESFQLGFLTDTISPLDAKIEAEFNRKLFRPSQRATTKVHLNINELLRANMDAKANFYSKMFAVGGYTVNEIRKELGNPMSDSENANKPLVQINMAPIDKLSEKAKPIDKASKVIKTEDNGQEGS